MAWFNLHGVWFKVKDGGPADIAPFIQPAINDLKALKDRTKGLEIKKFVRPGKWLVTSIFGREEIRMSPEFVAEIKKKRKRRITTPTFRLCPAFHTFDSDGTFIGLTACTGGQWGEPYQFIACSQNNIEPFENGFWNIEPGAVRPENYGKERFIINFFGDSYYEVPTAHDCMGMIVRVQPSDANNDYYKLIVANDWENYADWSEIIYVPGWPPWFENRPYIDNWFKHLEIETVFTFGIVWESSTYTQSGERPNTTALANLEWATFADKNGNFGKTDWSKSDGCYIYGLDYVDTIEFDSYSEPDWIIDNTICKDFVSVFGVEYELRQVEKKVNNSIYTSQYYQSPEKIYAAHPRIYYAAEDWFLASFYRADRTQWEYICFHGDTVQYNDDSAKYEYIDSDKHSLPITVNGSEVYGSGEFSLIKIYGENEVGEIIEFE